MACVAVNWSDRKKPEISSSTKMRNTGIEGVKNAHMPMVAALITWTRRDGKKSHGHDYDVVPALQTV